MQQLGLGFRTNFHPHVLGLNKPWVWMVSVHKYHQGHHVASTANRFLFATSWLVSCQSPKMFPRQKEQAAPPQRRAPSLDHAS